MKLLRLITLLAFCSIAFNTNAQDEFSFKHLGFKEGLPQSTIQQIVQDQDGFMWFASQDGLIRYDGYNFTTYRPDPEKKGSIANGYILDIGEDISGKYLWVTNNLGISRFDKATGLFENYSPGKNQLFENVGLCVDDRGKIWFYGSFGLRAFKPEDWNNRNSRDFGLINFTGKDTALNRNVAYIRKATKGVLLIIRGNQLWSKDENDNFYCICPKIEVNQRMDNNFNPSLSYFHKGNFFLLNATNEIKDTFLSRRNIVLKSTSVANKNIPGFYCGMEDSKGNAWFGGLNGLTFMESCCGDGKFIMINHDPGIPESISANIVFTIFEDKSGLIWMGTSNGGINIYNPRAGVFKHLSDNKKKRWHLNNKYIFGLTEDKYGDLWVGSMDGLHRIKIDERQGTKYFENITDIKLYLHDEKNSNSLGDNKISKLYASGDSVFIGTMGGGFNILNFKTGKFTIFKHDKNNNTALKRNFIQSIFKDKNKKAWVFTTSGPVIINNREGKLEEPDINWASPVAKSKSTISGMQDSKGIYWFAVVDGLIRYDTVSRKMKLFSHDAKNTHSLSFNTVSEIYEDHAGNLWVCTLGGGLNLFDQKNNNFTAFGEKDGLSNNSIFGILEDKDGNLWLSTMKGIALFNPTKHQFRNYSMNDGMPFSEFAQHSFWKGRNGWMFFGGEDGIVGFDPEEVNKTQYAPPIRLLDVKINYKSVGEGYEGRALPELNHIDLNYDQKVISFEFGTLAYVNSAKYKYAYRLEGLDNEWHYTDSRHRFATYTNLPFGHYVFTVKSSDDYGNWTETHLNVELWVIPPFYYTFWFISLEILFALAAIIATVSFVSRFRLRRKLEKLELAHGLQTERERISRELHDSVGSQLTYIISTLDNTRKKATDSPAQIDLDNNLENIGQFARESMQQLRESIWAMNKDSFSLTEFEVKLKDYVGKYLDTTGITWDIKVDANNEVHLSPAHVLHLFRIIQEAVHNTIKHAEASHITISMMTEKKKLTLIITDNGKGMKPDAGDDGMSHYGMANMRNRAKEINADFEVLSSPGKGTTVKLKMELI